jgi:AcrR family transcriptional regulator
MPPSTLRDRKRIAMMQRVQTVALDLFDERGFDDVTVEEIAARSEVSPSTVYRAFGTKEHLIIWDEYDPGALAAITEELDRHPPLEAVRRVVRATMLAAFADDAERIRRRLRLAFENPTVEAASTLQTYEMAGLIAGVLAQRLGRDADELDLQVFAHAFVGALLGGLRHWYASDFSTPVEEIFERPLELLAHGVRLE